MFPMSSSLETLFAFAIVFLLGIFRSHGPAWRQAQRSHLSLGQLKVMTAIEQCRSAALGGHVLRCEDCQRLQVAYNSGRNRHCPKCQASAAQRWLDARHRDHFACARSSVWSRPATARWSTPRPPQKYVALVRRVAPLVAIENCTAHRAGTFTQ